MAKDTQPGDSRLLTHLAEQGAEEDAWREADHWRHCCRNTQAELAEQTVQMRELQTSLLQAQVSRQPPCAWQSTVVPAMTVTPQKVSRVGYVEFKQLETAGKSQEMGRGMECLHGCMLEGQSFQGCCNEEEHCKVVTSCLVNVPGQRRLAPGQPVVRGCCCISIHGQAMSSGS